MSGSDSMVSSGGIFLGEALQHVDQRRRLHLDRPVQRTEVPLVECDPRGRFQCHLLGGRG